MSDVRRETVRDFGGDVVKPFKLESTKGIERNFTEWSELVIKRQNLTPGYVGELQLREMHRVFFSGVLYINDIYAVLHHDKNKEGERLSIWRLDGAPCNSWSDFQHIKNELISPEAEAIQVYPAESRLLDTDNVYHLFIVREKLGFDFGRAVWSKEK